MCSVTDKQDITITTFDALDLGMGSVTTGPDVTITRFDG